MKRILGLLMIIMVCFGIFVLMGTNAVKAADDDIASGTYDGVDWHITSEGELIIGSGEEQSYSNQTKSFPWNSYRSRITSVSFDGIVHGYGGMSSMFANMSNCVSIDVTGFDVTNVTNMFGMFSGCTSLKHLDLSNFNTPNLISTQQMFYRCSSLESLDFSQNFDTSKVKYIDYMFRRCSSLTYLDLSSFDTSGVIYERDEELMETMFKDCPKLQTVVLGANFKFGGKNITAYYKKALLPTPPTNNIYTGKWIREDGAYGPYTPAELRDNYTSAMAGTWVWEEKITLCTVFDSNTGELFFIRVKGMPQNNSSGTVVSISGGEYTGQIFTVNETSTNSNRTWSSVVSEVKKVIIIDEIKPKNTESWFEGFTQCTYMDLSELNTSEVTNMTRMFKDCNVLTTIRVLDKWDTSNLTNSNEMFYSCIKIVGGCGTVFDESKIDGTYAKVDSENEKGYLTKECKIEITTDENSSDSINGSIMLGYNESGAATITSKIGYRIKLIRDNGEEISINSEEYVYNIEIAKEYHSVEVETEAIQYKIISGDNQERIEKKTEDIEIKSNGPLEIFSSLMVDEKMLTKNKDYTVKKGSTIAIISKSYLDKLGPGDHSITFNYSNGSSPQGTMKISKNVETIAGNTKTQNNTEENTVTQETKKTNTVENETKKVEENNVKEKTSKENTSKAIYTGDKILITISTIIIVIALNILQIKYCRLTSRKKKTRIERSIK